ncbi:uncharacterized protein LOC128093505 [Culex pipiens pallens]|uniref:uncharacterized protein LOC128093505 n=1 Tax=Culex pipiens pallens TaxID=42434 RepID=UPI0022AA1711|nr:uncharacterized protein LOC128093505 [Culex pipiens pallens]
MILRKDCFVPVEDAQFNNEEEQLFFESNVLQTSQQIVQTAINTQTQSTNVWKIQRTRRITASSCYGLYTYLKNKNPDWSSKITRYWSIKNINSAAVKYGKETEATAFECYRKKRNPLMKKCGLVVKEGECWFASSPDGVDPLSNTLLEIKCPQVGELGSLDDVLVNETVLKYIQICPVTGKLSLNRFHAYYCQVQLNMWTLQCLSCDFVVYASKPNDFIVVEVDFDPDYVHTIVNSLKKLYMSTMLPKLLKQV